jgi:hypothetical protein
MKSVIFSGVRAPIGAAIAMSAFALGGCAELAATQQSAQPTNAVQAAVPSSAKRSPQGLYKVERVTPVVLSDAQLGWFAGGQGSPREVGTFVGKSVIQGLDGQFEGAEPVSMEVRIRQFQPSVDSFESESGGRHAVRLDFVLRDSADGSVVASAEGLVLDLVALSGTSAQIASNSGWTEKVRLAERIRLAAQYWAKDMNCDTAVCPEPVLAAVQPTAVQPIAAKPAPVQQVVAVAAVAAPVPAPAVAPAPKLAPEPAPESAPAQSAEAGTGIVSGITGFFSALFASGDDEQPAEAELAIAAAPAPKPEQPNPVAAVSTPTPAVTAPLAKPAPVAEPAPVLQAAVAPAADGQFFKSPSARPLESPQTALLRPKARAADPRRRRIGDVVLEVANLPAYWDGDATTGGVWVALPYIPSYRKAIVTNPVTGQSVQANLFWRDPQSGGSSTLLSSAAAAALGVAPGKVANLGVKIVAVE